MVIREQIIGLFGGRIRQALEGAKINYETLQEIRMRVNQPVLLRSAKAEYFLREDGSLTGCMKEGICPSRRELEMILENACGHSGYAFEEEMRKGYVTCPGGHRLGIAGQAVVRNESIHSIKNISSLNLRIAHEWRGDLRPWHRFLYERKRPCHVLIVSPPGWGKTTLLRQLICVYSQGVDGYEPVTVGVVDERSEIGGSYHGELSYFLGMRTDVLDGCPKDVGMEMLLRSMAPEVIAVDEIGERDVQSIRRALHYGSKILATLHGETPEDFLGRPEFGLLAEEKLFRRYIFLKGRKSPGEIGIIYDENFQVLWEE
jgi:stage III sporulation protein AA